MTIPSEIYDFRGYSLLFIVGKRLVGLRLGYSFIKVQKFNFVANIKYYQLFRNTVNNGYSMTLIISPACLTRGTPAQIDARLYFTAHFADTPYPALFQKPLQSGGVQQIHRHELSLIKYRPVVECTRQGFGFFQSIHQNEGIRRPHLLAGLAYQFHTLMDIGTLGL